MYFKCTCCHVTSTGCTVNKGEREGGREKGGGRERVRDEKQQPLDKHTFIVRSCQGIIR